MKSAILGVGRAAGAGWSACAAILLLVTGCHQPMRPSEVHLKRDSVADAPQPNIPAPIPVTTALPKPRPALKPETYSVVVNNVRVQELLFALARDASLNVDVHPGITGSVTLNAIDQTLPQLLTRIGKQVDMRWELDGPNLSVMPDLPYLRVYKVDYVNMERTTTGTVAVATQIGTAGAQPGAQQGASGAGGAGAAGAAGGAGSNASTLTVRNVSTNKFWATLEANIKDILRETDKVIPTGPGGTRKPPAASADTDGAGSDNQPNVQFREAASVIANPEAGVLIIRASARQHEKIQEFLDQVLVSVKRQVLIEGTIVEVRLSNQFQQGIDWTRIGGIGGLKFFQGPTSPLPGIASPNPNNLSGTPTASIFTGTYSSRTFGAAIRLLETFGTVRVLSSPRLSVVNNQTAILKVVDNIVYFTVSANTSQVQNAGTTITFTSTPTVVPVGFVMNITPQISDTNTVLLNLKPTISRILGTVQDPNPALANPCLSSGSIFGGNCNIAPIVNQIPQIQTRELESVIRVGDGQIAVMGGLIQDSVNNNEDGVPGVNRVPVLGRAFEHRRLINEKTELVIFLRPIVVKDASLDGDYRPYRVLLPDDEFLTRPHPARRPITSVDDVKEQIREQVNR